MPHAALQFDASDESRGALEGFFLTQTSLAGTEEDDDGSITFYVPASEWNSDFEQSLHAFCRDYSDVEFLGAEMIEDRNWNAEWEATIAPVEATRDLVITPSWKMEDAKKMGAKHIITIDPKMSFGTGHHETTRLCLVAIEELAMDGRAALDLGTGSGVLAMYALLRGAKHAVGIDTDLWAIDNAIENRALNNFSEQQFEIRQGTMGEVVKEEKFDVILANLHRNLLLSTAGAMQTLAADGAYLILSGILCYDASEVRAAYEKANFKFIRELNENEWTALVFQLCA
jgi:ribosomal protein L11 methyltransferase